MKKKKQKVIGVEVGLWAFIRSRLFVHWVEFGRFIFGMDGVDRLIDKIIEENNL